ncbi:MAG: AAA family ATPase [Acidobacteria bacterium]|nr:AAA family ATPase [Acidobacteriota bacterium]
MGALRARLDRHRARQDARAAAEPGVVVPSPTPPIVPVVVRLADVQPEAVTWIWPGRLAAGKITLLVGDPGLGKSWITCDVAARASTGRCWPDGAPGVGPCDVLMLSAEDGLADTIRPRCDALGADVARVHHLAVLRCGDTERAVQLADIDGIEAAIEQTGARIVTIDPLSAYTGRTDTHRDAEVRGLLAPLAALAERRGVAVGGVMHLGKSTQRPALYRAAGSIAFAAAARIVLAVAADPADPEHRVVAPIKSNLSRPPAALGYRLGNDRLVWDVDPVSIDIDALLSGPPQGRDRDEQTDAEVLIAELLEDTAAWPMAAKDAIASGDAHGIHERTMRRTARQMGIRIARLGFGAAGRWIWHHPAIADSTRPECPNDDGVSAMSAIREQANIPANNNIEDNKTTIRARARSKGGARRAEY